MTRLGEAGEALARAMGLWWSKGAAMPKNGALTLTRVDDEFEIRTWDADPDGAVFSSDSTKRTVTSHEAMLWLRCYLLGTTRVRCPDCEGSKVKHGPDADPGQVDEAIELGWTPGESYYFHDPAGWEFSRTMTKMTRYCPTCTGPVVECAGCSKCDRVTGLTGLGALVVGDLKRRPGEWRHLGARPRMQKSANRLARAGLIRRLGGDASRFRLHCEGIPGKPTGHVDRSWAEVFLRAVPTPAVVSKVAEHWGNVGQAMAHMQGETVSETPGDPESRARLTRLADQLQAQALDGIGGDSPEQHPDLGVWLALWLGRVPCDVCKGVGEHVFAMHGTMAGLQTQLHPGHRLEVTGCTSIGGGPFTTEHGGTIVEFDPCSSCAGSGLDLGSHAAAMASAALELAEGLTAQAVAS